MLNYLIERKYQKSIFHHTKEHTPYDLHNLLGTGSYGTACLMQHRENGKRAVLKYLRPKHRNKERNKQRFLQEIQFLKEISHPAVPSVLTEGQVGKIPYYVMDYVEGITFEQAIFQEQRKFTVGDALHYGKLLLMIVIDLHELGIVHRDLRIPNILLHDGQLYIIDFGLASRIRETDEITNPKKAENHISDLYFLGHFLLYLMYSDFTPLDRKNRSWQEELLLPHDVIEFIERLLLIRPGYQSAKEACADINNLIMPLSKPCYFSNNR